MVDRTDPSELDQPKRLVVLLLVMACAIYVFLGFLGHASGPMDAGNVAAAKAQIKQFDTALVAYKMRYRDLPNRLERLLAPPDGKPIMNAKAIPEDPWGKSYQYSLLGPEAYLLMSLGADGEPGGDGEDADIRSDELAKESAR